ncbi:TonB-dependent receptor [Flavobacterium sp. CYK-4]|uniref:TonB-dependent receptor n=1 Tax=Flavobacterium lotistagni TaxID=2709660 RepID=UPI00140A1AFA|nr:TonB-dependent receptor [Flavobacterium lotistagni]
MISAAIPHAVIVLATSLLLTMQAVAQQQKTDTTQVQALDEVLIKATRAQKKTPVSFSNVSKEALASRNLGQDIPILLNFLPSVVTTSDAGNGVGYTGIRVRGSDATRINVTINGVPYNDSESHGTFWVNMPDFASSVQSVQLQRGVGTSTNGSGAFGASLNLQTDAVSKKSQGEITNTYGSFDTHKHTLKFTSGLLNDHFEMSGRVSSINSHGYVDRAASDLKSYFLQSAYLDKKTLIKALLFGGVEKTYQSWNGIDADTYKSDPTYNSAGSYFDDEGNERFYANQIDHYQQHHFQLHWSQQYTEHFSTQAALHYTKGNGYYENFKEDATLSDYGLVANSTTEADLVNRKWLDNDFFGTTFSGNYKNEKFDIILGGSWNQYLGSHFGKIIRTSTNLVLDPQYRYYDDRATKTDATAFAKVNYQLTSKLGLFGDLQFRSVTYNADGVQPQLVYERFGFFNPKAGLTYSLNQKNTAYVSYAKAHREPNRTDYESGNPKPEQLDDYELGWRHDSEKFKLSANLYYMAYKDQLILTGNLDDVGNPIRSNSEKSYRLGIEIEAAMTLGKKLTTSPNISLSQNKNVDLQVNGENVGTRNIAYSPNIVAANQLTYQPIAPLKISWLFKFVGEQYLNNIESPAAKLPDYSVHDLNLSYEIKPKAVFKSIVINGLVNNVLDKKYISNGYMYDIYPYYYPQAGVNFLVGLTLGF